MFLPGTRVEIVNPDLPRGRFSAALFDFDGTLSLVREGWPEVMIPMMVDILAETLFEQHHKIVKRPLGTPQFVFK